MGVYIKGMDMPKNCDICPFSKTNDDLMSDDYRFRYCDFPYIGEFVTDYEGSRHPACPLIPVQPHGDLIERVTTITKIQKIEEEPQYQHDGEDWINGLIQAEEVVRDAPTVIEAEDEK